MQKANLLSWAGYHMSTQATTEWTCLIFYDGNKFNLDSSWWIAVLLAVYQDLLRILFPRHIWGEVWWLRWQSDMVDEPGILE